MKLLAMTALAVLASSRLLASPFDGNWSATYPCTLGAAECRDRSADLFNLELWSQGKNLCGTHLATAHLGDRVDENDSVKPSISGTVRGNNAIVSFVSSSWGGSGHARLTISGKRLRWHTLDRLGTTWLPGDTMLTRDSANTSASQECKFEKLDARK
jgi:hypothetical protein